MEDHVYLIDVTVKGSLRVLAESAEKARELVETKDPQTLGIIFEMALQGVDEMAITKIRKEGR